MHVPPRLSVARNVITIKYSIPLADAKNCDIIIPMKRSIWFWLCFVVAIILAVYFSVRIITTAMGRGPIANVRRVSISADTPDKDLSALAAAAAVAPGMRAYSVNLDAMNARIGTVPGVKESAVRRMPNGNLSVRVKMYRAVAQWTDGENYFPLSADGTIVNTPRDTRDETSVVFSGTIPDDITDITAAAHNLATELDYMEWIENRRWNMHMNGGITVMLPEDNPTDAIGALIVINNNHKILNKNIKTIDMRDPARILVK